MKDTLTDFRCSNQKCHQLQFKYKLIGSKVIIEVKCYACNAFSTFTVHLNRVQQTAIDTENTKR